MNLNDENLIEDEINLVWPFYKYKVLIPQQIKGDLFVWLYLSLIILKNRDNRLDENSYTEEVINSVKNILCSKFSSVISSSDNSILNRIIDNAEAKYVQDGPTGRILIDDTFSFIDSYSELFSDKLEVKTIYQDAISGAVLPYFDDDFFPDESDNYRDAISATENIKRPSKNAVKIAYKQYDSLKINNNIDIEESVEEEKQSNDNNDLFSNFDDHESAVFEFDEELDELEAKEPKKKFKLDEDNYNVIYLDNTNDCKLKVYFDVKARIEDNSIVVDSPFNYRTNIWMNRCFKKAININNSLVKKIEPLKALLTPTTVTKESNVDFMKSKHDVADSLSACGPLYRLVSSLPSNTSELQILVLKIDSAFKNNDHESFYTQIGKMLECLIKPLPKSEYNIRRNYQYAFYCNELRSKCFNLDYNWVIKSKVFDAWSKGYESFKADVADLLLFSNLTNSNMIYYDFIEDTFELYDKRNKYSHYNNEEKPRASIDAVDLLFKITTVFADLY